MDGVTRETGHTHTNQQRTTPPTPTHTHTTRTTHQTPDEPPPQTLTNARPPQTLNVKCEWGLRVNPVPAGIVAMLQPAACDARAARGALYSMAASSKKNRCAWNIYIYTTTDVNTLLWSVGTSRVHDPTWGIRIHKNRVNPNPDGMPLPHGGDGGPSGTRGAAGRRLRRPLGSRRLLPPQAPRYIQGSSP